MNLFENILPRMKAILLLLSLGLNNLVFIEQVQQQQKFISKMGCMGSNTNKDEPLSKKKCKSSRNTSSITVATNEDEEKMMKHKERILNKKSKENKKKKNTMDEDDLKKTLNEIFDKYDKDGDGCLDLPQFMQMLRTIAKRPKHQHVGRFEEEAVRRVLAKNDDDGDISVNRQEFYDLYKEL